MSSLPFPPFYPYKFYELFGKEVETDADDLQIYTSEAGFAAKESGREERDAARCWDGYRCDGLICNHTLISCRVCFETVKW